MAGQKSGSPGVGRLTSLGVTRRKGRVLGLLLAAGHIINVVYTHRVVVLDCSEFETVFSHTPS